MAETDWDAPLGGTGEQRSGALRRALSLRVPELEQLIATLNDEMSSEDWGYRHLSDIADVDQRALVSDQLRSAADGLMDALVDAAISAYEVHQETGPTGLPYATAQDSLNDMLRFQQLRRAVAGFFNAAGTALDCLSAVLIVVAHVPLSVQRADFAQLRGFDPGGTYARDFPGGVWLAPR